MKVCRYAGRPPYCNRDVFCLLLFPAAIHGGKPSGESGPIRFKGRLKWNSMEIRIIGAAVALSAAAFVLASCTRDAEEGRQVTDYREYTLTLASERIPGVFTSCGNDVMTDVYAVRQDGDNEWTMMSGTIEGFDYEAGYEYRLRVGETSYLDYSMGEPAWTEYSLLEEISRERKESEGLPDHFIPQSYYQDRFVPEYRYFVDADDPELVGKGLGSSPVFPAGCHCIIYGTGLSEWIVLDDSGKMTGRGILEKKNKDYGEFPDSYLKLPPEGNVRGYMEWKFLDEDGNAGIYPTFDVFLVSGTSSRSEQPVFVTPYLYVDLTESCKEKYPEAGVRSAVVSYAVELSY